MSQVTVPLIDREIFFGNPVISGAQLSPDGQYITFIKPLDGTMNIWIKKIDQDFDDAYPLTNDTNRPITSYFWSRDSRYVLYVQDKGGDENYRVYRVDPKSASANQIPEAIDLTPYPDIRAMIVSLPKKEKDKIYIGINDRDKAWHDFYSINIDDGERSLIIKNDQKLNGVIFDLEGELRLGSRSLSDGGNEILKYHEGKFEQILTSNLEESCNPIRFDKKGNVYIISNVGEPDLTSLYSYNLDTHEMTLLESDPEGQVDIENVSFSSRTDEMIATIYVADKKRIYWKEESYKADYDYLRKQFSESEISITSSTKDEALWIIYLNSDTEPGNAYLFDRKSKQLDFLYTPRPDLPSEHLAKMQSVTYTSTDGLQIPAYLTLPRVDEKKDLPAIMFIHGGPWARDYWGYNSYAQFLANRGYVVLQPNFRGSTGYGKKFLNAAINQWGEKMQDDITAGAQYLIDNNIASADKIAIMGGSYGGYATLAGLTFTPDVYAAGVSIVGPSNLFTLLETIPPYWESARVMFHKRMGDPNTDEGRAQLRRQSPFFHAANIKAPLLVAQGANDPRVKKSESDQIVIAMRELDLPVEYVNFPDEGHGFANPDNNMSFVVVMEKFLAKHLGGRFQEDIPDRLSNIIKKVTVDIQSVEMPKIISEEEKSSALPIPTKEPNDEKIIYTLQLEVQGQNINFEIERNIKKQNGLLEVSDNSSSPMGNMTDLSLVALPSFSPSKREVAQGPLEIKMNLESNNVSGVMVMDGKSQDIALASDLDFLMDGPSLDLYLCNLELSVGYQCILRVLDTQGQKFQTFSFTVQEEETLDTSLCYKCQLQSLDGQDKSQTLWITKSSTPLLYKKSSIIPEMGGAKMTMRFKHLQNADQNPLA